MDHMHISGINPSVVIFSKTKNVSKLMKYDAQMMPK